MSTSDAQARRWIHRIRCHLSAPPPSPYLLLGVTMVLAVGGCAAQSTETETRPLSSSVTGLDGTTPGHVAATDPPVIQPCGSRDFGINIGDASGPAVDKAKQFYEAALACDTSAIVEHVRNDKTKITVLGGADSAELHFSPDDSQDRYFVITALMSTSPGFDDGTLYWPYIEEGASWPDLAELSRVGLWGSEPEPPEDGPGFYTGWSIGFGPNGEFAWFFAGG